MTTIVVVAVILFAASAVWLRHEAVKVARPEYDDYNARMDAADRWLDEVGDDAVREPAPRPAEGAVRRSSWAMRPTP